MPVESSRKKLNLWLTVEETATVLRVHPSTVREKCRQGKLPHIKIGATYRVDRDGLFHLARTKGGVAQIK